MALSPTVRTRLEIQGFFGLDDATLADVEPSLIYGLLFGRRAVSASGG